jgi:hypothetical protein
MSQPGVPIALFELQRRGETVATYELSAPRGTIGRSSSNAIRLVDFRVSRLHAQVEWRPGGSIVLIDMDSHGGTWVDGCRLRPRQAVPLADGSRIVIVDHVFIFHRKDVEQGGLGDDQFVILHAQDPLAACAAAESAGSSGPSSGPFQRLLSACRFLGLGESLEEVLGAAIDELQRVLPAASVFFLVDHLPGPGFMYHASSTRRDQAAYRALAGVGYLRKARDECHAMLVAPAPLEPRPDEHGRLSRDRRPAWLCVPLIGLDSRPIGLVVAKSEPFDRPVSGDQLRQGLTRDASAIDPANSLPFAIADLHRLCQYALPLGWALELQEAERESGDRTSREIRAGLPSELQPALPGYSLERRHIDGREFQANLCEFVPLETDREKNGSESGRAERGVLVLIDVPDRGVKAALTMSDVYLEIRRLLLQGLELPVVLTRVNRLLLNIHSEGLVARVLLARIDALTHQLTVLNAGHDPIFVVRGHGTIETPKQDRPASTPLGTSSDPVFGLAITHLEPRDWTVFGGREHLDSNELQLLALRRSYGVDPIPAQPRSTVLDDLRRWALNDRQPSGDVSLFFLGRDQVVPQSTDAPDDPIQS